jgi:hypothetical protein
MAFDAHKNLAITTIIAAPSPPTSGSNISVTAGEGGRFPTVPFNATIWPAGQAPTPINAEVVRVTFRSGDTIGVVRAQEGTTARSIVVGDLIAATVTAKALTDIESGTNFNQFVLSGPLDTGIRLATADGADTGTLFLTGGGAIVTPARGAFVALAGNEAAGAAGNLTITAGGSATGAIIFNTGFVDRGKIHPSGGFSWGGTIDPGPGKFLVAAGSPAAAQPHVSLDPVGQIQISPGTTAAAIVVSFYNSNGNVGSIVTNGTTTSYNTTSDARLKDDRGALRIDQSGDVLRQTVVHEFTWKSDGTPGRGVFAQEAAQVAPFAVTVGTDETDEAGHLMRPWAVDYAKYVPDLIVGWQHHDATLAAISAANAALSARVETLEARLVALEAALAKG